MGQLLGTSEWTGGLCPFSLALPLPSCWDADVTAGALAAILDHEGQSLWGDGEGSRGPAPEAVGSRDTPDCLLSNVYKRDK